MSLYPAAAQQFRAKLCSSETPKRPAALGVAVSGGGDSMALLQLLARFCRDESLRLEAVTVDHGLRPEAQEEAAFVAETCAALEVPHCILHGTGWDGEGNLQAVARAARYGLIADWSIGAGLDVVALGHTADDQAETVLMNVARGSGVDGLCGMAEAFEYASPLGVARFARPLLGFARDDLRAHLTEIGQKWVEDPSNEDLRFERVRARRLLAELADLGLTRDRLTATAERMRDARDVLADRAFALAEHLEFHAGDVLLPAEAFYAAPADSRHRVLAAVLCILSGQNYRPRFRPLREIAERGGGVLHGCNVSLARGTLRITREAAVLDDVTAAPGESWDGRFLVSGPFESGDIVCALGKAALGPLPKTRDTNVPRQSLMASPAVWRGDDLVAAPLAGIGPGWQCEALQRRSDFLQALLSR